MAKTATLALVARQAAGNGGGVSAAAVAKAVRSRRRHGPAPHVRRVDANAAPIAQVLAARGTTAPSHGLAVAYATEEVLGAPIFCVAEATPRMQGIGVGANGAGGTSAGAVAARSGPQGTRKALG